MRPLPNVHERQNGLINEEILQRHIRKVSRLVNVFIFITGTLHLAAMVIYWLIVLLFLKALAERCIAKSLKGALFECNSRENVSCYSEIMQTFFPFDKITQSPRLSIRISSSSLSNSVIIYELGFPLSAGDPFIVTKALVCIASFAFIMAYFRNLLVEIAETTAAIDNNQVPRRGPAAPHPNFN